MKRSTKSLPLKEATLLDGVFDDIVIKETSDKILAHTLDLEDELKKLFKKFEKHGTPIGYSAHCKFERKFQPKLKLWFFTIIFVNLITFKKPIKLLIV